MTDILPDATARFLRAAGPVSTETQREMEERAREEGFPIIGPDAGGLLCALARARTAATVFEFGSGFGYSASWFARGIDDAATVVLTEHDEDELELAREFAERGGYAHKLVFEAGDAFDVVERYAGPFDVVLFDHQKRLYADAIDLVREKLEPGGVIVADNMMRGPIDFEDLLAALEGERPSEELDEPTAGVAEYLRTIRADPGFDTSVLPVGSGLAVSAKR